jgi:acetate---CoA ligase (ADP-forming)
MGTLSKLFAPERVAVVGATDREGSVGRSILTNLRATYDGEIVPVNPNRDSVLDLRCYPDVASIPSVDLAVVVLPVQATVDAVRRIGEAGIENVVVITAGFSEIGRDGADRERKLVAVAEEYDLNVVGPNSLGVMSTQQGLNATFGHEIARPGSISFVSQSGAFITAVLDWANDYGLGFRDVVSLGNEAVLDQTDFIREWGDDPDTDAILGYLEGIDDGREFIDVTRMVTDDTPVILAKSGRTEAGAHAASSHTGSIAGSEQAYEAGFAQAGVIRVESFQELLDVAQVFSDQPDLDRDGVAIVTNAGGPGVMTTDAIGDSRLTLAEFSEQTLSAYEASLSEQASIYNPVDIVGDADAERFGDAVEVALSDEQVGAVLVVAAPSAVLSFDELAGTITELRNEHDIPIVTSLMGGDSADAAAERLREHGVSNYFDPTRAVRSLEALSRFHEISCRQYEPPTEFDVDYDRAQEILRHAAEHDRNRLGVEAMELLDAYGVPIPVGTVVDSPDDAVTVAEDIEGPVVMKIVSTDIQHKSDIGGVKIGVEDDEVADVYEELITRARNYQPDASIMGVQVQEQVDLEERTETIVGLNRDPQFGPMLLFGLGGIFVEVLEDTTVRIGPISETEAVEMTEEIQSAPVLRGARGRPPADIGAIGEALQRLSQLAMDFPAILELDINPLVAGSDEVYAIDLRLTIDTEKL